MVGAADGLQLAASIESKCVHPVAAAIVREAELRKLKLSSKATLEQAVPGGILGTVEGKAIAVGNLELLKSQDIQLTEHWRRAVEAMLERGEAPLFIAVDSEVRTVVGLSDPLRPQARETIDRLRREGWQVGVLSGDHPSIVARVCEQLGMDLENCHGGLSPEEKLQIVRDSREKDQTVVMVGDGANDAAALAAADVGIAMRGGAEVSLRAAPVFVATGQLTTIHNLVVGAKRTGRVIRTVFPVSLSYNLIAVGLAMTGWITPLAAALLMPISSVSVLAIVLAARTFEDSIS